MLGLGACGTPGGPITTPLEAILPFCQFQWKFQWTFPLSQGQRCRGLGSGTQTAQGTAGHHGGKDLRSAHVAHVFLTSFSETPRPELQFPVARRRQSRCITCLPCLARGTEPPPWLCFAWFWARVELGVASGEGSVECGEASREWRYKWSGEWNRELRGR